MVRKAMTMILAAMLLGGAATIPTMAQARGGGGGGHFGRGCHFGGGYYGGHYGGIRCHYYGWGGYWGTPTPRAIRTCGLRTVTSRKEVVSASDASAIDEHSAI